MGRNYLLRLARIIMTSIGTVLPPMKSMNAFGISLQLPDNALAAADDLIEEYGWCALPMIGDLVVAGGAATFWQIVDVVTEGGGRTTKLRG